MALPLLAKATAATAVSAYLSARLSLPDDLLFYKVTGSTLFNMLRAHRAGRTNLYYLLEERALSPATASAPFLIFEGRTHTYAETYARVLRWGEYLRSRHNVQPGEVVALDFMNSDNFVLLWFALWSLGAVPAFVNYYLTGRPLVHTLKTSKARLVLVDPQVAGNLTDEVRADVGEGVTFLQVDDGVEKEVDATEPKRQADEGRKVESYVGMAILIYTSGTTGMPKPAVMSWLKIYMASMMAAKGTGLGKGDVFYLSMPLYHSSASCIGVGSVIFSGAAAAIGRRFSTSTFWKEIRETGATVFLYVGETCRYLAVAPPEIDPITGENLDKKHKVRVAFGNGLRPDVWDKFKNRFGIDTIFEFYAATEGPVGFWNRSRNDYSKGAIGRYGVASKLFVNGRTTVVAIDPATDAPWRDPKTGLCRRSATGESGEMLGRLDPANIADRFQGYYGNPEATSSKILRDVLRKGDAWFRTGDIMRWEGAAEGRLYFNDRIGDTYRWKSENVSTTEVSQVVGLHPAVQEANVYGVQLPHHDGRAGCVAVALSELVSVELLASLAKHSLAGLPKYAVPVFVRVQGGVGLQTTGTNKQQKHVLRDHGVDPAKMEGDQMFWLKDGTYQPWGEKEWLQMQAGEIRL